MNESELKVIVEQVVRLLLAREAAPAPKVADSGPGRKLLFVINGSEHGHDEALAFIRSLGGKGMKAVASPCYVERYGIDALVAAMGCPDRVFTNPDLKQREAFVDQAEAVIYLLPARTAIGKLANAMPDDATTAMVMRAMLRGVPVLAAGGDCDAAKWPKTTPPAMKQGRGSYAELLNECLDRLAGWGLQYRAEPAELLPLLPGADKIVIEQKPPKDVAKSAPRSFLTSEDIRKKHADGAREIKLPPNCTVTDEARELAASLSVKLVESP